MSGLLTCAGICLALYAFACWDAHLEDKRRARDAAALQRALDAIAHENDRAWERLRAAVDGPDFELWDAEVRSR